MKRLFEKLRRLLTYLDPNGVDRVYQAYQFAYEAHKAQRRRTGELYVTHPVAVACILAKMHMDVESLIAALLHDVLEDTSVPREKISDQFGEVILKLVDGVTKLTRIEQSRAEIQAQYFRKMILAMSEDIRVMLVKLADRLHNMRTIESLTPPARRRIAQETLDIFAPIANRLGMHEVAVELEELGFAARYPMRYRILRTTMRKARSGRESVLSDMESKLKNALEKRLGTFQLVGREKHLYSIYRKMKNKRIPFFEIMDVYAFRVIVSTEVDCYTALGAVHNVYKPVPGRFKDYIATPKINEYQSLHTTLFASPDVPVEIQIRTQDMDVHANKGIAAHWLYKSGEEKLNQAQLHAQRWIQELLELQQRTGSPLEFIETVKLDLFPDEVYVCTPNGEIIQLPAGSTIIDFAYAVHTQLGNTCVAAKVDKKYVPLSTVLSSGQTVEIITAPNALPKQVWLKCVVTARARSNIRHAIKHQRIEEASKLGSELFSRALDTHSLKLKRIPEELLEILVREAGVENLEALFEQIGLGNRIALLEVNRLLGLLKSRNANYQATKGSAAKPILIRGSEGLVVNFSECCWPLPGDSIVAVPESGLGLKIHVESCHRLDKLRRHTNRLIPVVWADTVEGLFPVDVFVEFVDQQGVLATIALAISNAQVDIHDIEVTQRLDTQYIVRFRLLTKSRVQLARVLRNVRRLKAVLRVARAR